ncbi:MAG: hypothetical protein WC749_04725, partial [Dehalococcoidia bacterium]
MIASVDKEDIVPKGQTPEKKQIVQKVHETYQKQLDDLGDRFGDKNDLKPGDIKGLLKETGRPDNPLRKYKTILKLPTRNKSVYRQNEMAALVTMSKLYWDYPDTSVRGWIQSSVIDCMNRTSSLWPDKVKIAVNRTDRLL